MLKLYNNYFHEFIKVTYVPLKFVFLQPLKSLCYYLYCCTVVPKPSLEINIMSNQTVGQSLTLEGSITTVRGITSRVDIVWSSNSLQLIRIDGLNLSSMTNYTVLYTEIYTILQLSTLDEGRTITCDVFINALTPVTATDNVTLNVTGKCNNCNI